MVLVAGVVTFLIVRSHPDDVLKALRDVDLALVLAALALNLPVALLTPLRAALVFGKLGYLVPARILVPTTILGFVAGGLTPGASGELLRAQALRSAAGVPFEAGVVAVVYERGLSLYLLMASSIAIFAAAELGGVWVVAAIVAAVPAVLAPGLVARVMAPWLEGRSAGGGGGLVASLWRRVVSILSQTRVLLDDWLLLMRWSAVSLAMFLLIAAQYWLLARAVGDGAGFGDAWLALGVSTFAGVAALIPLGLGVLDGSLAATLDRLGMTLEQGTVVALLVRGIVTVPLLIGATGCYFYLQRLPEARLEPASSSAGRPDEAAPR